MKFRVFVIAMIFTLIVPFSAGQIAPVVPLPADLHGELNGVPYHIVVPANWNGTLLVYAHGYSAGPIPPNVALLPADVATLAARGFALAASRFGGTGWNVKEGMQNTANLTAAFREMVGKPTRTIMWGGSMGGLMTLGLIEKFPGLYDGAVALCPPASGTPRRFDLGLDIALAYSVAFGWDPNWGTPGDLRDDLNYTTDVLPQLPGEATKDQIGRWEFIRLVNHMPKDSFYAPFNFKATNMYFATGVRAELEHRAGGPVAQNVGREYALSDSDTAYITDTYDVDAQGLLDQLNALKKISADRNARNYAEHYVNPSGRITRPVITVHARGDSLAIPNHAGAYRDVVMDAGKSDLLVQQFTSGVYHCAFTSAQDVAAIDAMMNWLDTGNRPDQSMFNPALGFLPGYVIEPWPW